MARTRLTTQLLAGYIDCIKIVSRRFVRYLSLVCIILRLLHIDYIYRTNRIQRSLLLRRKVVAFRLFLSRDNRFTRLRRVEIVRFVSLTQQPFVSAFAVERRDELDDDLDDDVDDDETVSSSPQHMKRFTPRFLFASRFNRIDIRYSSLVLSIPLLRSLDIVPMAISVSSSRVLYKHVAPTLNGKIFLKHPTSPSKNVNTR